LKSIEKLINLLNTYLHYISTINMSAWIEQDESRQIKTALIVMMLKESDNPIDKKKKLSHESKGNDPGKSISVFSMFLFDGKKDQLWLVSNRV
jgi:hypothetical protein